MRHGKSSWEDAGQGDRHRPLLKKGIERSVKAAEKLKQTGIIPDLIFSSNAVRAHETAKIVADTAGIPQKNIHVFPEMYEAGPDTLLRTVFSAPDDADTIMLTGHNPGLTTLSNQFLSPAIHSLPTSGMVCLRFNTKYWNEIPLAPRETLFIFLPKEI